MPREHRTYKNRRDDNVKPVREPAPAVTLAPQLEVFVPSRSRFDGEVRLWTLDFLQRAKWKKRYLAVPKGQVPDYRDVAKQYDIEVIGCPRDGIAATRQFIGLQAKDKFLMLDDDLRFFERPAMVTGSCGVAKATPNISKWLFLVDGIGMRLLLQEVERMLDKFAHVAVSARQNNNNLDLPYTLNHRPLRALAYRKKPFLTCKHGRVQLMEDFDVTLQLMSKGYSNAVITSFAQDQYATQLPGGCSDYRDHASHETAVRQLAKLHDPFVTIRKKESVTNVSGEFGDRIEATIYWKKVVAAAYKEVIG